MSFILDALKKSESERQRADTPALYEVKMAPARPAVATWLIALAVLLGINVVVLCVVLLRGSHSPAPQPESATVPAPASPAPAVAPPATQAPPAAPALAAPAPLPQSPPAAAGASPAADDDAPAVEPARAPAGAAAAQSDLPSYEQAASAAGSDLPQLKLDLHVYANRPSDRFVFLNMLNLKEGQTSPAGVRVEAITPDGAILSWHGAKFFLHSQ